MDDQEARILALEAEIRKLNSRLLTLMKFVAADDVELSKLFKDSKKEESKGYTKFKCKECNGTGVGKVSNLGLEKCKMCKGAGTV